MLLMQWRCFTNLENEPMITERGRVCGMGEGWLGSLGLTCTYFSI